MEAGLRLLFQAAQKELVPPPAQNDIGDDLPDGIVILRLFSGEKGMMVQNELTDGLEILGEEGTGAQAGLQGGAVYNEDLLHGSHLLSVGCCVYCTRSGPA